MGSGVWSVARDVLMSMQYTPWSANKKVKGLRVEVEDRPGPVPLPGGLYSSNSKFIRWFWEKYGKTEKCAGCHPELGKGRNHSAGCKKRQESVKVEYETSGGEHESLRA